MKHTKRTLIKKKIFIIMLIVIILQACTLVLTTLSTGMFSELNKESYRILNVQVANRADTLSASLKNVGANVNTLATSFNKTLLEIAKENNVPVLELYLNDNAFYQSMISATDVLIKMMNDYYISGGYYILNGSNFAKNNQSRHAAVYIRDSLPMVQVENNVDLLLERGSQFLAKQHQIALGTYWDVDFNFLQLDSLEGYDSFYSLPMEMAYNYPDLSQEDLAFWAKPVDIFQYGTPAIMYSVPLVDENGVPFGVFGIEISLSLIQREYLPYSELPYANSFYSITNVSYGYLRGDWFINSGPFASRYLETGMEPVMLKNIDKQYCINELLLPKSSDKNISGNIKMYCTYSPILLYDKNSVFDDGGRVLLGFVPKSEMHKQSSNALSLMLISIGINIIIGIVLIRFAVHTATKDIVKLPEIIRNFNGYGPASISFDRTNIAEIDELTSAIENLYKNVSNSNKRINKIVELTAMPIGCYETGANSNSVFVTKSLLDIIDYPTEGDDSVFIDFDEWNNIYNKIISGNIIDEKVYHYVSPNYGKSKYLRVESAEFEDYNVGIIIDVSDEIIRRRQLEWELDSDVLTKLLNSKAFKIKTAEMLENDPNFFGVMIYADLDDLKRVNDTYGHEIGDMYIMRSAEMFKEFEKIGGIVARVSGDEFIIYVHGFKTWKDSLNAVKDCISGITGSIFISPDNIKMKISTSFGVASYPLDSKNVSELIRFADFAMYEAKNTAKGTLCEFNKEFYLRRAFLSDKREALNKLIDNKLIKFAFQPIVDVKNAKIFAYEALMRSLLDEFKTPSEIIAVAKSQSQMYRIEKLTILAAMEWLSENESKLKGKKLFINTIASQLLNSDDINLIQNKYKELFASAVFEIAESDENAGLIDAKINIFRERFNALIAIDDYGSGNGDGINSLNISPDYVKIDIGLVRDIHYDATKQNLVSDIITACHDRNISVMAEGVELEDELKTLIKLGVDYAQGYYFSKPVFALIKLSNEQKIKLSEISKNRS